jgi:hypothetical protein
MQFKVLAESHKTDIIAWVEDIRAAKMIALQDSEALETPVIIVKEKEVIAIAYKGELFEKNIPDVESEK